MKALWDKLNVHRLIPSCTYYQGCRCEAMRLARSYILENQAIQFLTGLNEKNSVVKTQVLMLETLPSINKTYSLVAQEESNMSPSATLDTSNIMANALDTRRSYGQGRGSINKTNSRFCTHCNKPRHTI